jgi:thiamine biosynthesis lipoprotein
VKTPPELFRLLADCVEYSRKSEGAFDISVGPLMKTWGFYKGSGNLPGAAEVKSSLERVGYRHILLDAENHTVRFARKGVELDPGGIGKGYAVDRMAAILKDKGVETALISGGGSSIYAMGAPPGDPGWNVKIRDPRDETRTAIEVFLKDESMSTSGSYEKFFMAEGRMFSHIMDPRTGYPAKGMLAVSVIAPRALDSEAWTKPVFILGREWAAQHIPKGFRAVLCEDKPAGTGSDQPCAWLQ